MERLTARNAGIPILAPEYEEKYRCDKLIDILIGRLASYEDLGLTPEQIKPLVGAKGSFYAVYEKGVKDTLIEVEKSCRRLTEAGNVFVPPVKVGDKLYSVTYDKVPKEYVIGDPEEIVEVGTRGFFFAWKTDTKYPVEFHPYEELGKEYFLTFEDALRAKERLEEVHQ